MSRYLVLRRAYYGYICIMNLLGILNGYVEYISAIVPSNRKEILPLGKTPTTYNVPNAEELTKFYYEDSRYSEKQIILETKNTSSIVESYQVILVF